MGRYNLSRQERGNLIKFLTKQGITTKETPGEMDLGYEREQLKANEPVVRFPIKAHPPNLRSGIIDILMDLFGADRAEAARLLKRGYVDIPRSRAETLNREIEGLVKSGVAVDHTDRAIEFVTDTVVDSHPGGVKVPRLMAEIRSKFPLSDWKDLLKWINRLEDLGFLYQYTGGLIKWVEGQNPPDPGEVQ